MPNPRTSLPRAAAGCAAALLIGTGAFGAFAAPPGVTTNTAATAATGDSAAIGALMDKAQWAEALQRADESLKTRPKDAQLRFQRAAILAELSRNADAAEAYEALIQDFPELPEPYNNLGVLYAAQGNYGAAYAQFQKALVALPAYATAHENIGDLLIAMAADHYQQAVLSDAKNRSAPAKLAAARELAQRLRAIR